MTIKSLKSALKENGFLDNLKSVVSGIEKLNESQLKNVGAGLDDGVCGINIGPPCAINIGPINNLTQGSRDQTDQ